MISSCVCDSRHAVGLLVMLHFCLYFSTVWKRTQSPDRAPGSQSHILVLLSILRERERESERGRQVVHSRAVEEKEAGRGPLGLMDGRGGMAEGAGLE